MKIKVTLADYLKYSEKDMKDCLANSVKSVETGTIRLMSKDGTQCYAHIVPHKESVDAYSLVNDKGENLLNSVSFDEAIAYVLKKYW